VPVRLHTSAATGLVVSWSADFDYLCSPVPDFRKLASGLSKTQQKLPDIHVAEGVHLLPNAADHFLVAGDFGQLL